MRFKAELTAEAAEEEQLALDYSRAEVFGALRLGERFLFIKGLFAAAWLPYGQIVRVWLRQEEVKARLCCGTANFDQFYVVLECADGLQRRGQVADKAEGLACLEGIAARNPAVKTGYMPPEADR